MGLTEIEENEVRKKVCEICKDGIRANCGLRCTACNRSIHVKCFEQASKIFNTGSRINWKCATCNEEASISHSASVDVNLLLKEIEFLKRENELLAKLVSEQDYVNHLHKQKIEELSSQSRPANPIPTYSEIVKKTQDNTPILLIKPHAEGVSTADIQKDLKKAIRPEDLNVHIRNTREIKNGGVLVRCQDDDSLNKIKSTLAQTLSNKYSFDIGSKFTPRVIIQNVDKEYFDEDVKFKTALIKQNDLTCNCEDINVVHKNKNGGIVIAVAASIRNILIQKKTVYIGWARCTITDYFSVIRCFNCSKFGHFKSKCNEQVPTCPKCAEHHEVKNCKSQVSRCINCINHNNDNRTNFPIDHSARDSSCQVYKLKCAIIKTKTDYGN